MPDLSRYRGYFLSILRFVAGLMFWQHGAQKLFGWLGGMGGNPDARVELASQMGLAGIIEFFGGAMIALGIFTRPVAFIASGEMAVAYFQAHASDGFWPIQNGGELPVLFCFIFLYFVFAGGGPLALERLWKKRDSTPE